MRNLILSNNSIITVVLALVFVLLLVNIMPLRPQMLLYPLARQIAKYKVDYQTRDMAAYETEHFIIKYTPADADNINMIATAAESAYVPVTESMGYTPKDKTIILVRANKQEMQKAFGWSGNESAMGVYYGGVIQLLSPSAWLTDSKQESEFIQKGPMVHEYTHLVFDYITNGNYPRWFTEGLAQYVEYQVNGYEWVTPDNNLDKNLYTLVELDKDFDALPNQALAYRESLAAVRYIAEVHGKDKLQLVITNLQKGQSMEQSIKRALGLDYAQYETQWKQWAIENMQNKEK